MKEFVINPNDFLKQSIRAFYHQDYTGYGTEGNPDYINYLKNQFGKGDLDILQGAIYSLKEVLEEDLPQIKSLYPDANLMVCVIPRAKKENSYFLNQKWFRRVVSFVVDDLDGFSNGTTSIIRHTDTITTHMHNSGYGGDGKLPYPNITKDTCEISDDVIGKDILLIDDLYTKTINIDEDAIQSLLDKGAKSVIFYAIGKTASKY